MLTLAHYFGGRREMYPTECSPSIEANAARSILIFNDLIKEAKNEGIAFHENPKGEFAGTLLTSGWRPPSINAKVPWAAKKSLHMTGQAADIYDPQNEIDDWLQTSGGLAVLQLLGIWIEHPSKTPGWSHWQVLPPKSGNRMFYP